MHWADKMISSYILMVELESNLGRNSQGQVGLSIIANLTQILKGPIRISNLALGAYLHQRQSSFNPSPNSDRVWIFKPQPDLKPKVLKGAHVSNGMNQSGLGWFRPSQLKPIWEKPHPMYMQWFNKSFSTQMTTFSYLFPSLFFFLTYYCESKCIIYCSNSF